MSEAELHGARELGPFFFERMQAPPPLSGQPVVLARRPRRAFSAEGFELGVIFQSAQQRIDGVFIGRQRPELSQRCDDFVAIARLVPEDPEDAQFQRPTAQLGGPFGGRAVQKVVPLANVCRTLAG